MLSAKSVSVRLRKWNASDGKWHWALRDIDLNLVEGDRLGVVGRNGSGKSTLCRALAGILKPTRGSVSSQGTVVPLLGFGAACTSFGGSERQAYGKIDGVFGRS